MQVYRGRNLNGAAAARAAIAEAEAAGGRLAAFFSESILSCGGQVGAAWAVGWWFGYARRGSEVGRAGFRLRPGAAAPAAPPHSAPGPVTLPHPQVILPEGYLAGVYAEMRAAGAVCVADEVQCGFGRVGRAFWGFQLQGVVPDIVTFGKPW